METFNSFMHVCIHNTIGITTIYSIMYNYVKESLLYGPFQYQDFLFLLFFLFPSVGEKLETSIIIFSPNNLINLLVLYIWGERNKRICDIYIYIFALF